MLPRRPRGLTAIAIIVGVHSFMPYVGPRDELFELMAYAIHASVLVLLVVTYFFWRGKNWARIVFLVLSFLSVLSLPIYIGDDHALIAQKLGEAVWSGFLIYWLNTARAQAYFKWKPDRETHQPTNA